MAIEKLPTDYKCPQCGERLQRMGVRKAFLGKLLVAPFLKMFCDFDCPKCGRIDKSSVTPAHKSDEKIDWDAQQYVINGVTYENINDVPVELRHLVEDADNDGVPDVMTKDAGEVVANTHDQSNLQTHIPAADADSIIKDDPGHDR